MIGFETARGRCLFLRNSLQAIPFRDIISVLNSRRDSSWLKGDVYMIERVVLIDSEQVGCQVFERGCLMTDTWFVRELTRGKTFSELTDMLANLVAKDKEELVLLPKDKVERDGAIDVDFLSDEFSDEIVYVKNCTSNSVRFQRWR